MDASIVIATRDRRALLARTLDTLAALPQRERVEILVADHGSTDGTEDLIERYATSLPVRRVPVPFRHESIADPKNAGAYAATGDLLVFLDAGMMCPPHFLTEHFAAHRAHPGAVVAGAVFGWDSEDESEPFWRTLDLATLPAALPAAFADPRADRWRDWTAAAWMLVWGANVSLARRDFLQCGGFDPDFRGWGWDDLELAYRLYRQGHPPVYAADAWAVHYPHGRATLADRVASAGRNWRHAYARHRATDLETWEVCDYWDHARCQRRLRATSVALSGRLPRTPDRPPSGLRRLLYGYEMPSPGHPADTYVALPGLGYTGTGLVSYGLYTGLPDRAVDVAVVSSAVLAFDWSPSPGWPPLAVAILREMGRVAGAVEVRDRLTDPARAKLRTLAEAAGLPGLAVTV